MVEGDVPLFGHLSRSSSGVYVCVATNSVGEDRVELTLVVEGESLLLSFSLTQLSLSPQMLLSSLSLRPTHWLPTVVM